MAELRARERRRREDFCKKTAHDLARDHALVVLEDLRRATQVVARSLAELLG